MNAPAIGRRSQIRVCVVHGRPQGHQQDAGAEQAVTRRQDRIHRHRRTPQTEGPDHQKGQIGNHVPEIRQAEPGFLIGEQVVVEILGDGRQPQNPHHGGQRQRQDQAQFPVLHGRYVTPSGIFSTAG
jgi:hypothetical protein